MRSFSAATSTPDDDLFVGAKVTPRKPEKSKIAKQQPLLMIETDSSGSSGGLGEENMPKMVGMGGRKKEKP